MEAGVREPFVNGDFEQLKQVFFNVIHIFSNSISIWQNWVVYKLSYMPVETLECIICKY